MIVPDLARAVIDVDVTHARFHQAARHEAAVGERRAAIFLADRFGLFADVVNVGRFELHAVSRFHGFDAPVEKRVLAESSAEVLVERGQRIHLARAAPVAPSHWLRRLAIIFSGSISASLKATP